VAGGHAAGDTLFSIEALTGSAYADTLRGDDEANTLIGGGGDDELGAAGGNDRLEGRAGRDDLYGGDDDDRLFGGNGDDYIYAGPGNDRLEGSAGKDILDGGSGTDRMAGGAGADRFDYNDVWFDSQPGAANRDTIVDFKRAEQDKLDLRDIDAVSGGATAEDFRFVGTGAFTAAGQVRFQHQDGITIVQANVEGDLAPEMEIAIVGTINLGAGDFLL
jgi:Ca2+-binding RTX toxin-like protein